MNVQPRQPGKLACIGLGMMIGAHLSPRARAYIERADVLFVAASDPIVESWIFSIRPDSRSLQHYYQEGKSRHQTYEEMVSAIVAEVEAGNRVCAAFYGHPGVFAKVPHDAVTRVLQAGFEAVMEPAISAEDCLYADLGIDPGRFGCQHYEASQLLFFRRSLDPSAYLVLWQVGVVGDRTYRRYATSPSHRQLLVDRLSEHYPTDHTVILYEAATIPIADPRMEYVLLCNFPDAKTHMHTTLVVPPCRAMQPDNSMIARLALIGAADQGSRCYPSPEGASSE